MPARALSRRRIIGWARIILPLAALGVLASLFLFSRGVDFTTSVPVSKEQARAMAREPRIGAPQFSAVADDGTAITLSASIAHPGADRIEAEDLRAIVDLPDGSSATISASQGSYTTQSRLAVLQGKVEMTTTTGYRIATSGLRADLRRMEIRSTGPILATGPVGRFTAARMVLRQQPGTGQPRRYELIFTGGINLVYQPEQ